MTDQSTQFFDEANAKLGALLGAQERLALADLALSDARAARDQAILEAAAAGFPRRALARAAGLTPGRVQQIVDLAHDRPDLQPALRMERERRQRSKALGELARRRADEALAQR